MLDVRGSAWLSSLLDDRQRHTATRVRPSGAATPPAAATWRSKVVDELPIEHGTVEADEQWQWPASPYWASTPMGLIDDHRNHWTRPPKSALAGW